MAWFFTDTPLSIDGDWVQRRFLMYGGTTDSTVAMDDLWLFDLTNMGADGYCPWHEISSAASGDHEGIFGGTLIYRQDSEEFDLIGGYTTNSGARWSSKKIFSQDPRRKESARSAVMNQSVHPRLRSACACLPSPGGAG